MKIEGRKFAVGLNQTIKAVSEGKAEFVYIACDADEMRTEPLKARCRINMIPYSEEYTMRDLGKAAGIKIGAAAVVIFILQ